MKTSKTRNARQPRILAARKTGLALAAVMLGGLSLSGCIVADRDGPGWQHGHRHGWGDQAAWQGGNGPGGNGPGGWQGQGGGWQGGNGPGGNGPGGGGWQNHH